MSLTFVVLNPSDSEQRMNSSIADAKLERGTSLANGSKCRCHHNETSPRLRSQEQGLTSLPETLSLPPFSVSIYSFPMQ